MAASASPSTVHSLWMHLVQWVVLETPMLSISLASDDGISCCGEILIS